MTFDPTSVEVTCVTVPKDHCVQVPWEYVNVCGYSYQFCKNYHIHTYTYILRTYYVHTTYYVQNQWSHSLFLNYFQARQKNLNQRSLTPRWPLTPCLLRSHVWLYARIIVSKSRGNTSMYVDTVINFANYHIHSLPHTYTTTYIYTHTTYILRTEWVITYYHTIK